MILWEGEGGSDGFLDQINPKGKKTIKIPFDVSKDGKYSFLGTGGLIFSDEEVKITLEK